MKKKRKHSGFDLEPTKRIWACAHALAWTLDTHNGYKEPGAVVPGCSACLIHREGEFESFSTLSTCPQSIGVRVHIYVSWWSDIWWACRHTPFVRSLASWPGVKVIQYFHFKPSCFSLSLSTLFGISRSTCFFLPMSLPPPTTTTPTHSLISLVERERHLVTVFCYGFPIV